MGNYIINQNPQSIYANGMKLDLGDIRVSAMVEVPEGVSQVIFNNNTIVDMSYDNVVPEVVHNGYMFHASNGNICTGTYDPVDVTQDTVNPNVVYNGYTFHDANGNALIGVGGDVRDYVALVDGEVTHNDYTIAATGFGRFGGNYLNALNFNKSVTFGKYVSCLHLAFATCNNFNSPVNILYTDEGLNCYGMFSSCSNFNQPINIMAKSMFSIDYMFQSCSNFNQSIIFPNAIPRQEIDGSIQYPSAYWVFAYCNGLRNQNIIFGNNYNSFANCFANCEYFSGNVVIKSLMVNNNARNMFSGKSNSYRVNLYVYNIVRKWFNTTNGANSITTTSSGTITWQTNTANNCQYNVGWNIYIYNYIPGWAE